MKTTDNGNGRTRRFHGTASSTRIYFTTTPSACIPGLARSGKTDIPHQTHNHTGPHLIPLRRRHIRDQIMHLLEAPIAVLMQQLRWHHRGARRRRRPCSVTLLRRLSFQRRLRGRHLGKLVRGGVGESGVLRVVRRDGFARRAAGCGRHGR